LRTASEISQRPVAGSASPRAVFVALLAVGATLAGVAAISPVALLVVFRDGSWAAGIIAGAAGLGLVAVRMLRLPACPLRWELLGAVGLGLGLLSLLVLVLGAAGMMQRSIWFAVLGLFYLGGVVCVLRRRRGEDASGQGDDQSRAGCSQAFAGDSWLRWLWLGVVPFAILAALAATMPPGTIWPEEGSGYDVLEYHLGAPRDYLEAGRISYLPNNIYANQPLNVEMLYLLAMILHGDAVLAAFTANMLNLLLGVVAVACVWLGGREYGRRTGIVAGLAAASCPFLTYLCGLAYNENGMALFASLSMAAVLRAERLTPVQRVRWLVLAGLFAGFACGCKYTAVPMILVPLALAAVWQKARTPSRRLVQPVVFAAAAVAAFAPWMIKNVAATGNPLFPLARTVFRERPGIWDDDGAARWHEGHLPAPEDRPLARRLARLGSEVLYSKMYGPLPILAIGLGGCGLVVRWFRRRREGSSSPACWLMLLFGIATWLAMTHLAGRFAVVLVVPCSLLTGRAWGRVVRPSAGVAGVLLLGGTIAVNASTAAGFFSPGGVSLFKADVFGRMELVTQGHWPGHQHVPRLNEILARGEKVLVVGDARRFYLDHGADYCVVFNRNPFAEAAAALSPASLLDWLRERQYRHVYVDWGEMHRLRTTRYGFWEAVDATLFGRLSEVGLEPLEQFGIPGRERPYATLFRIADGITP
jgi:hypothetical protein